MSWDLGSGTTNEVQSMPLTGPESSVPPDGGSRDRRRRGDMLSSDDREQFATSVIEEVRRWPGVELRAHASPITPGEADGIEFRLYGRQIGHVHGDCSVHLALTKALKASVVGEHLAEPLEVAPA